MLAFIDLMKGRSSMSLAASSGAGATLTSLRLLVDRLALFVFLFLNRRVDCLGFVQHVALFLEQLGGGLVVALAACAEQQEGAQDSGGTVGHGFAPWLVRP